MCKPRTVELVYDEEDPEGFCSRAPYPPALELCQESRNAVINSYPLCFGSIFFPAIVRFNFALDTLFIDNELEENLPHLFSTFKDAEINGLRYLALDEYYIFDYRLDEDKLGEGLHRALKTLKSLKEIQLVFDVESLASMTLGCDEGHKKILYDELPKELSHINFDPLPTMEQFEKRGITVWDGPCRPVYGWRRCGSWEDYTVPDYGSQEEYDSDADDWSPSFWPAPRMPLLGNVFPIPGSYPMGPMGLGSAPFAMDDDDEDDEDQGDLDEAELDMEALDAADEGGFDDSDGGYY